MQFVKEIINLFVEFLGGVEKPADVEPEEEITAEYLDSSCNEEIMTKDDLCKSLWQSLQVTVTIIVAVIPLALFLVTLLYVDLNSSNICFLWRHDREVSGQSNNTVLNYIMKWKLIGENIQDIFLNVWFPCALAILFGGEEFMSHYAWTLSIGLMAGIGVVIYKTICFVRGVFGTKQFNRYPGNALFLLAIILSSIYVAKKNTRVHPSRRFSFRQLFILSGGGFFLAFGFAMSYRYILIPWFNSTENEITKALIAAISPTVYHIVFSPVYKYFVMNVGPAIIQPNRIFILLYFLPGINNIMYRMMQADFKSLHWYILLSLLRNALKLVQKSTESYQEKIVTRLVRVLRDISSHRSSAKEKPRKRSLYREVHAALEIQDMLLENNTIVLCQAYRVLYLVTNYEVPLWFVLKYSLIRMSIGLVIDSVFNYICTFIQVHWYGSPIRRVWSKYWKSHMMANGMAIMVVVIYFTPVLLTVFQVGVDHFPTEKYNIRNCSLPFAM